MKGDRNENTKFNDGNRHIIYVYYWNNALIRNLCGRTSAATKSIRVKNEESVKVENRVFTVQGKGDVKALSHLDRRAASFSPFEPTGLYAKPNEEITIDVEGNNEITAYIGAFSYNRNSQGEELVKSFTLKPGTNTIRYEGGGMIYFYNKQENGTIRTTIQKGGTPFLTLNLENIQNKI